MTFPTCALGCPPPAHLSFAQVSNGSACEGFSELSIPKLLSTPPPPPHAPCPPQATRKDVIAKCYGGDVSRKRKLLDKQKEGKKRMKKMGSIDVPADLFPQLMRSR